MRIDVTKFLFIGAQARKNAFFTAAQRAGIIEFFQEEEKKFSLSSQGQMVAHAIKALREFVQEEQILKGDDQLAEEVAAKVVFLKESVEKAEEHKRLLEQEIARVRPFGDFSLDTIRFLELETHHKARFFFAKQSKHLGDSTPALVLINREEGIDYFFTFADDKTAYPDAVEVHIERSLDELALLLATINQTILESMQELKTLTRYNQLLRRTLIRHIDQTSLAQAQEGSSTYLDDHLFVAEGWVPDNKKELLIQLAQEHDIYAEEVVIESTEIPPTYLENQRIARVGEDLVSIFDTPANTDKDPSLWVLGAFSLFFAMIVGDAGYGLLFLGAALFLNYRLKKLSHLARRVIALVAILGTSCLIWGGLTNSFFGITLAKDNPLRTHSLMTWLIKKKAAYHIAQHDEVFEQWKKRYPDITAESSVEDFLYPASLGSKEESPIATRFGDNIFLELALFIGSFHIILGLLRYLGKNPVNAGWVAFIIGAYLYLPTYVGATSLTNFLFGIDKAEGARFGLHLLTVGAIYATIVGVIRHGITGIFEVMTSLQIFGDVLSYLRIYALGLAGATISALVNDVAAHVPLIVALFIIIACHGLNIILAVMGGVIHGLRLNFLEWYHYSFEGGGKPFQPLQLSNE